MNRQYHGLSRTASYAVWCGMKTRCYNKKSRFYEQYGGRGIAVCDRWIESFAAFFEDMGDRPEGMSIERVNNDLGYEPGNCVWATRKTQARNRRGRNYLTVNGQTKMMSEWADSSGVSIGTIWERIRLGWSHEKAVMTPVGGAGFGPKPKRAPATGGMDYIRRTYGVPAKRGGKVIYTDSDGVKFHCTIKSATNSGHLKVLVDDRIPGYRGRMKLHPTWNVEYLQATAALRGLVVYQQPETA